MEQANFSELRDKVNTWDIQAEETLIQKIKLFTLKYNEDFQSLCKNFDNFSNAVSQTEVDHLKAINQLKSLSNQRFVEQSLEKKEPSQPENQQNENLLMDETEKMKQSIDLSMQFLETISKKNKKEVIEDDAVSVQSSKMTMEKNTKGVKLPYIIGTEMFKGDKAIGLDVAPEEEEEEDEEEQNELTKYLVVDDKQKKKWDKIEEKRKKKKEKELKKKQKNQKTNQKQEEEEEPEVKVPIENEEEPKQENQNNQSSSEIKIVAAKTGGAVPPPPPPPPPPPVLTAPVKPVPKPKVKNPVPPPENKIENVPNPAIPPNNENQEQNVAQAVQQEQPSQPKPPPMSFQDQLRNRFKTMGNNNNPLAPVAQNNNVVVTPQNVKLGDFIGGNLDGDEDEDIGDIKNSLFRTNPRLINPNNNLMNQPPPNQNVLRGEKPNLFTEPEVKKNQEENASEEKKKLTESQFIQITKNENLDNARKKMGDIFGSDDEDEDTPKNIVDKTKDLTNKLNNIGITSNPQNEPKKEQAKPLQKKTFFADDEEDDIKIKKEENKVENNINNQQDPNAKPEPIKEDNDKEESKINKVQAQPNPPSFLEGLKGKLAQRNEALAKKEEPKKEEPKKEEIVKEEPKKEEEKKEEPQKEEVEKEEPKISRVKTEEPKKEEPKLPEVKKEEIKKEEQDKPIKRSTTMNANMNSNMNKRFSDMQNMLASKMGKGMMFGQPKPPKPQEEKIEHNAPADKGEPTYEEVIKTAAKKVVKRKKPKRVGTFGIGEGRIEVPQEKPKELNEIKEVKEEHEEKNNEEPKNEEIKEEPKNEINIDDPLKIEEVKEAPQNEETKPELNEPSPPKPQVEQKKVLDIKNSLFSLFTDKDEQPKQQKLFDKVELNSNPPQNNNQEQKPNTNDNFLNNTNKEVQNSKLFFLEDDDDKPSENKNNIENINNNKKADTNKKKLAFFDDDD